MSIYIKNAKMPECCAECPFDTFADDLHYCTIKQLPTEDYWECRPPFCPMTEVPEPHGRLIDADACIDYIRNSNQRAWEALAYEPTVIEGSEPLER